VTITLLEQALGEDPFVIGVVVAPATITAENLDAELDRLWSEWREEVPDPDTDSEFTPWLTSKGWREVESFASHTFFT
jgi:hypothetical protein